jgi:hypothetical protein
MSYFMNYYLHIIKEIDMLLMLFMWCCYVISCFLLFIRYTCNFFSFCSFPLGLLRNFMRFLEIMIVSDFKSFLIWNKKEWVDFHTIYDWLRLQKLFAPTQISIKIIYYHFHPSRLQIFHYNFHFITK